MSLENTTVFDEPLTATSATATTIANDIQRANNFAHFTSSTEEVRSAEKMIVSDQNRFATEGDCNRSLKASSADVDGQVNCTLYVCLYNTLNAYVYTVRYCMPTQSCRRTIIQANYLLATYVFAMVARKATPRYFSPLPIYRGTRKIFLHLTSLIIPTSTYVCDATRSFGFRFKTDNFCTRLKKKRNFSDLKTLTKSTQFVICFK